MPSHSQTSMNAGCEIRCKAIKTNYEAIVSISNWYASNNQRASDRKKNKHGELVRVSSGGAANQCYH